MNDTIKDGLNGIVLTLSLLLSTLAFAISLDPDQARQNVEPDLDTNSLTLGCYN